MPTFVSSFLQEVGADDSAPYVPHKLARAQLMLGNATKCVNYAVRAGPPALELAQLGPR